MKYLFILLILASCAKEQVRHSEVWQVQHITSEQNGAWCFPRVPVYDTITIYFNIANPDDSYIRPGYSTRETNYFYDNLYHYIYYEKQLN